MEKVMTQMKEEGLKMTPQRMAVFKLLRDKKTHPSAEMIYSELKHEYPTMSVATVYNTLSTLAEAGLIQELSIDPNKKRFDPCTAYHHHFFCKVCRNVFDIADDPSFSMDIVKDEEKKIEGHQVEEIQVNLKGVCRDCRKV